MLVKKAYKYQGWNKQTNKQANIRTDKTKTLYSSYFNEIAQQPLKIKWLVP